MLFERTALSRKPEKLAEMEMKALRDEDKLTPELVFRDPYLLDFLGLKDTYAENDLEAAILREMEAFILELALGSRSWSGNSVLPWMTWTITWTCFFIIAICIAW